MKTVFGQLFLLCVLCLGCTLPPQKPGYSTIHGTSGFQAEMKQSENPKTGSSQAYERTTETEVIPTNAPAGTILHSKSTEKSVTTVGASQKDETRGMMAKLASLKFVVWIGVAVFLFGIASAFYPPLKLIVGSVTTSAACCAAGLALIVLPSFIVGHEILILAVAGGGVGIYWFAHRHGCLRATVETLQKKI